ncbi:Hypothetical protein PACV_272 [Pacmanvirus A23]|uniref:Hypothetical protein n=1 Tax=Pacmanvirus A23 TaxID=1932881 RepID=UPI000A093E4F|nr:Hypothetical protein B9W72_gp268 [Pacmanvirus A23]SIP85985.1 Hypothetical protein PACV_272 [Pacmanvirus A23]
MAKFFGEIGFINLHATILGSGLIDNKVTMCDFYNNEKEFIKKVLLVQYDIDDVLARSRPTMLKFINNELKKWWQNSRYNVQIDKQREEIMESLISEVKKYNCEILSICDQKLIISSYDDDTFSDIQSVIAEKQPDLISYYEIMMPNQNQQ